MISIKASVATAILAGSIAATASATYAISRLTIAVTCPAPTATTAMKQFAQPQSIKTTGYKQW